MRDEEMNIPHLFRCPISLDLFEDPVTLCTGQTYDRSSIERWLKAGNLTCPVTMQKLQDPSLVPNHTLQHLIHHWLCMDNREDDPVYTFDSDLSLLLLKHDIESRDSTFKTRIEALRRLTSLSEELEWRKTRLVKLGFFEPILKLVFSLVEAANLCPEDSDIAEESLHCLLNLLPCIQDMRPLDDMLKQSSHLATFQVLLEQGSKKMKMNLCSFIEALTSSLKTREICSVLGQTLLHLVSGNDAETAEAANKAVLALCSLESNRDCFTKEGAVDSLVLHLSRRNQTSVAALATLELLLESDTARNDLGENPNGVRILVKMVFGVCFDHKGSESAVSSLLSVCYESAKARDAAISAGVLTQLLLLLQSQCSSRAKNKGRVLLKLLRST